MNVSEIMTKKVVTVAMDDVAGKLRELFQKHHFHHLMVLRGGYLVGVVSDRDLLRHVSPFVQTLGEQRRDEATLHLPAHQIMTRTPITVGAQTDVIEAARIMVERRISCLPVIDAEERLLGVVTSKDLLRAMVAASPVAAH